MSNSGRGRIYDFTRQNGAFPHGTLVFNKAGNLYGTAGLRLPREVEQVPKTQRQVKPLCLRHGYYRAHPVALICFQTPWGGLPSAWQIISETLPGETNIAGGCVRA